MSASRDVHPALRLALDLGPLLVFFGANAIGGLFVATAAFMVAIGGALVISRWRTGAIAPMLWFTAVVVGVFGGLTLWLHDATFIKVKPTILYGLFAAVLFFGLATGRPLLRLVLGQAYPSLSAEGWRLLTRNWAAFFILLGLLNELAWRNLSTDRWVDFKVWGVTALTFLFALAQAPLLKRHGGLDGQG